MSGSPPIPAEVIDQKIASLRANVEAATVELERLRAELEWWEAGQRLFGNAGHVPEPTDAPDEPVSGENGKPTLREAILTVLGQEPRQTWKTDAVIAELRQRGWLPNGENAEHHTRSMLAQMHRKGQAKRMERGRYRLPPTPKAAS